MKTFPSAGLLLQLKTHYPDLQVDAVAGDAGFGFEAFLHTVYAELQARRVIDRRATKPTGTKPFGPPVAMMIMDPRSVPMGIL